jgi:heptosyltransferase-2
MATPALRALRHHFPAAQLLGVMRPAIRDVLQGTSWLDAHILYDPKGPWRQRWPFVSCRLSAERIDLTVLFPNSFRAALVAYLGGCRRRIGFSRYARSWMLTDRLLPESDARGNRLPSPVIDAYNRLAVRAGCPPPGHRMELAISQRDQQAAATVWSQAGFAACREVVCLNPGGAFGPAKHWPAASFATLTRLIVDRRGSGVLVLCGPAEKDVARTIAKTAARSGVHSLADYTPSIGLTKACVHRASLLVTTDSGPRHFAAALDRPVVTLFGPTHIAWTETYYPRAIHLQKKVPCGPCQLRNCPLDHQCMTTLTPEEVFRAVEVLLGREARQAS